MEKMTKEQAARKWVNDFNFYPMVVIERLIGEDYEYAEELQELTPATLGDTVYYGGDEYQVEEILANGHLVLTNSDDETVDAEQYELEFLDRDFLPMWGTMFDVPNMDQEWVRDNLDKVAECGFRIYDFETMDLLLLGIDGAGYDFYEAHWIPLYEARGLTWHKED